MSRTAVRALLAALLFAQGAVLAEEGCTRDVDCKGDRICVQRECVPPPPAEPAPPAATQPRNYPAQASQPARPNDHHRGFFFRPDLGLGYMTIKPSGSDDSFYGFAGSFGIALGGSIAQNHILAFHLWDLSVANPTASNSSVTLNDTTFTVVCGGPEYTWYSRDNFYISVSPGLSRLTIESNGVRGDTNAGFGMRAALGKEWWVSQNWGLGVVGQASFSVNKDQGGPGAPTFTAWGTTIAFSATYN